MSEHVGDSNWLHSGYAAVMGLQWDPVTVPIVPAATVPDALRERFDAQTNQVTVLDAFGNLLWVNRAWRDFARQAGMSDTNFGIGMNYLDVCDRAHRGGSFEAGIIAGGIRDVIAGVYSSVYFRYGFELALERHLFAVRVTRAIETTSLRLIVAHERIL